MRARRYIGVFLCLRPELHGFKWIFSPSHRLPLSHRLYCWACWTRTNDFMNISHAISPTNLMSNLAGREGIKPPSSGLESDIIIIIPTTYFLSPMLDLHQRIQVLQTCPIVYSGNGTYVWELYGNRTHDNRTTICYVNHYTNNSILFLSSHKDSNPDHEIRSFIC